MVALNSDILLDLPAQGRGGTGISIDEMTVHWHVNEPQKEPCRATFKVCAMVSDVRCETYGNMTFRTQTFVRQHAIESGVKPMGGDFPDDLAATWIVRRESRPSTSDPGLMKVSYRTEVPDN
jgi:hypothetical protein